MRVIRRRIWATTVAGVLCATTWLLVETRPALPSMRGLSTASRAEEALPFLAWLGCLLIVLGLLARVGERAVSGQSVHPLGLRRLRRRKPVVARAVMTGGYTDRAFPLKLRSPEKASAAPSLRDENTDATTAAAPLDTVDKHADGRASTARIALLGPLLIAGSRRQSRRLRGATRELLCYLALQPAGAQRDQIIDTLWPDQSPEQGRNRLWRAAADARSHFGEEILIRDGEHYQLQRGAVDVDLDRLEQLWTRLPQVRGENEELALVEEALALFRGRALAGSDLPWAAGEQRRLDGVRLDLLARAGEIRLASGDAAGALAAAEAALSDEPYNEQLARVAMQAEAALGLRNAVIERYERLRETLDDAIGIEPHSETKGLFRRLLS